METPKNLTPEELEQTNGGSDSASSSRSGLLGNIGIGNLASGSSSSQDGDESNSSNFSLGNGITGDLGGILNNDSQKS